MLRDLLTQWVNYARANNAIIFFDAAYEAYISDPAIPIRSTRSPAPAMSPSNPQLQQARGLHRHALRLHGRPQIAQGRAQSGEQVDIHKLWTRRTPPSSTRLLHQPARRASRLHSRRRQQTRDLVTFYMSNAKLHPRLPHQPRPPSLRRHQRAVRLAQNPRNLTSWQFFDHLLTQCHVVGTPGSGFGAAGEGFFRLSAFNSRANVEEAMTRLKGKV